MIKLSLKLLAEKKGSFLSAVLLVAFGAFMLSAVLQLNQQVSAYFKKNIEGIDLVVGAEGSPLQLILSSVLHADYPTGNVSVKEVSFLAKNRMLKSAVPLLLGDSHQGFRIVGTTLDFQTLYSLELQKGRWFNAPLQAVFGANAAKQIHVHLGDVFTGSHGLNEDDMHHHDAHPYRVVGILKPSGTVVDDLILTHFAGVWQVHDEHHHQHETNQDDNHDHANHSHNHNHNDGHHHDHTHHDHTDKLDSAWFAHPYLETWHADSGKDITAVLLQFKNPMAAVQLPRIINEKNNLQSANPIFEIARLLKLLGVGVNILLAIAAVLLLLAALIVFISINQLIMVKRFELMMLRVMGAKKADVISVPLYQMLAVVGLGLAIGLVLSKLTLLWIKWQQLSFGSALANVGLNNTDIWVCLLLLSIGTLAALWPVLKLYRLNPHQLISEK